MERHRRARAELEATWNERRERVWDQTPVSITRAIYELRTALGEQYPDAILAYMPTAWPTNPRSIRRRYGGHRAVHAVVGTDRPNRGQLVSLPAGSCWAPRRATSTRW